MDNTWRKHLTSPLNVFGCRDSEELLLLNTSSISLCGLTLLNSPYPRLLPDSALKAFCILEKDRAAASHWDIWLGGVWSPVCWQVNMLDFCGMERSMRMNSRRDRFPFRLVDYKQVCNEDGHYFPASCGRAPYLLCGFVHLFSPAVMGNIRFLSVC